MNLRNLQTKTFHGFGCPMVEKNCGEVESLGAWNWYLGVSKNSGTPKWMVYKGNPYFLMDDLGYPYFWKHPFHQPSHISETIERRKKPPATGRKCSSQSSPRKRMEPSVTTNLFCGKDGWIWASLPRIMSLWVIQYCWWFRNPANHLGCTKPCKRRDILPIKWCRISSINNMFPDIPLLGMTFRKKHFKYTSDQLPQSLGRYLWTMASWCFQPFWKISITLDQFPLSLGVKMTKMAKLPPPTCSSSFRENYY